MATNFEKLQKLLEELFQLDQADLDFGIYRIMNQKRDEVVRFLEKDLLPQVKEAFGHYKSADKATLQKELDKLTQQIEAAGMNPDESPKVQEVKAQMADSSVDVTALENEVFSHLFNFFRRYYHEGDFISLRRYKEGVYAIPYEGEEVKLHWANHDQYYVKSSEYFRDYIFTMPSGKRVRVHLVAASSEQDNKKEQVGKERRFIICKEDPIYEENAELFIRFEYRPDDGKQKQDALNQEAIERVVNAEGFDEWVRELSKPAPTKKNPKRTVLEKHLTQYTARNTFDYFIHKDLGGFLRRELDFYIKNEVMHLDDIEHDTVPRVEQYLSKIKVIRKIAHKVIQFLEQLENFQKKLWLKKKFVVETNYCITLDRVPEELYPEIAANDAQREEWVRLFAIDEIEKDLNGPGYTKPLTVEFLKAHHHLPVDTQFFPESFVASLLSEISDIDGSTSGILVHAENFQGLNLMQPAFEEAIDCTYIDPPYNTGDDGFPYKDSYRHSSWLSALDGRLRVLRPLLASTGVLTVSIGREEIFNLAHVADQVLGPANRVGELVWEKGRKNDARYLSLGHDYILVYARDESYLSSRQTRWREEKPGAKEILEEFTRLRALHGNEHAKVEEGIRAFYASLEKDHPSRKHRRFNRVDDNGLWRDHDISWPSEGGPKYDVPHPVTKQPCKVPNRGWRFATYEKFMLYDQHGFIQYREDHTESPILKRYLNYVSTDFDPDSKRKVKAPEEGESSNVQVMPSVFYKHSEQPVAELKNIMGGDVFPNPKDPDVIQRLIAYLTPSAGTILDFYAGSGTTGQAVIALQRKTGLTRRFIQIDCADHFDRVLKPRTLKVLYASSWKDGRPTSSDGLSATIKYIRVESYEDALNNLELKRTSQQASLLEQDDDLREQYVLSYMLDVESRGSQSLLNVESFRNPDEYKLRVERDGETQLVNVDLVETFNWLLGLTVKHIDVIRGVRVVEGTNPNSDRTLVLWRNLDETDNEALDEWFKKQDYNTKDQEYDLIYVNGDNNLENLRRGDQTWKVRLIEEEFARLMFDVQDV